MAKRLLVFTLLTSIIAVGFTSYEANSAAKPQKSLRDRVSLPVRKAPVYAYPTLSAEQATYNINQKTAGKIALNTGRSNPAIIGYTTYDNQHNCTMARQVEHRGTEYVHFDWMAQDHDVYGVNRGIGYQVYEITGCDYLMDPGGVRVETDYAGYVGIDADPGGWAILGAHQKNDAIWNPGGFWDFTPGGPAFGIFTADGPSDIYGWGDNSGTGPANENIWPKIEWHLGTESVLHMVTTEKSILVEFHTISYYRRVGPYGSGNGIWSEQRLIDSVMSINPTVVTSPVSDKVAIVWNAPADYKRDGPDEFANQYENDVWYTVSTNQGADWAHDTVSTNLGASSIGHMVDMGIFQGDNITEFNSSSSYKAYCDISALISTQDELHIVWGCRRWDGNETIYRRQSAIFHWAENTAPFIRPVVIADWDTGGACYGHSWGSDAAKMTISECDDKLYLLFTQFASHSEPCSNYDNVDNVINGRLYMSVYDPLMGDAWDRPQRITSTLNTPECIPGDMSGPGDCNSEYWASMARYGRFDLCQHAGENVLDILYINDYTPGACVQTESGVWTVNPVMWLTIPCREVIVESQWSIYPHAVGMCYGEPIFIAHPHDETYFIIVMENYGHEDINFEITVEVDSSNSATNGDSTAIEVDIVSGVLPWHGGVIEPVVSITTTGEMMNTTVYAHVSITHDASDYPPSPFIIPICITIPYVDNWNDRYTLSTACKRLRVYNNGQMSNYTDNESMDYIYDPDDCAEIYLYDGSPIICRDIDGEKRCFFAVYEGEYESEHALRQMSSITVDSVSNPDYVSAGFELVTADSAIGMYIEYFVPQQEYYCEFIIKRTKFWNRTPEILTGVAVGAIYDWDIPNWDHGSKNESGYDPDRHIIYQYCCTTDPCDSTSPCYRYAGIAPVWDTFVYKNCMTLENDIFVYTSGPFGNDAPLPPDTMYGLMSQNDGPSLAALDSCEDLSTLITYGIYDLHPGDTQCVMTALATSRNDPAAAQLKLAIGDADYFASGHDDITCFEPHVCSIPGDANGDGNINIGDAVYIINYIFRGGPPPVPYSVANGDANGDCECNVGDAVYEINYIFRGGPPPVSVELWNANCN
jgi:hypothetical protein